MYIYIHIYLFVGCLYKIVSRWHHLLLLHPKKHHHFNYIYSAALYHHSSWLNDVKSQVVQGKRKWAPTPISVGNHLSARFRWNEHTGSLENTDCNSGFSFFIVNKCDFNWLIAKVFCTFLVARIQITSSCQQLKLWKSSESPVSWCVRISVNQTSEGFGVMRNQPDSPCKQWPILCW